ncbi:hypothetical protein HG531_008091 [Fusarium graminearum]|nr:hypothetical protein HG531_008091 [Fusarium graminearum]
MKYRRFSPLLSSVSGDLQVLQVTYSTKKGMIGSNVLFGSLHALADIGNVGENSFSVAFSHALGWGDLVALCSGHNVVGVPLGKLAEESRKKHGVANGLGLVVSPNASSFVHVTLLLLRFLLSLLSALLQLKLLELLGEVVVLGSLGLLLLLLQGQVETSILGGGSIVGRGGIGIIVDLLRLLLLLLHERKVKTTILSWGEILSSCRLRISKGLKGGRKRRRTRRVGLSRILGIFGSVNHGDGTVSVYYDLFVGESNGFARFTFGRCL